MSDDEVLLLGVLADGPYWTSALEILGPPPGTSFHRDFDYRPDWVHDNLLSQVADRAGTVRAAAVVGLRFRNEDGTGAQGKFIPLRHATAVVTRDGDTSMALVLGDYVQIDEATGDLPVLTIPEGMRTKAGNPVLARFATGSEAAELNKWRRKLTPDHLLWKQLATSPHLPQTVRDRFQNRVVLYCTGLQNQRSGERLRPTTLGAVGNQAQKLGYKLRSGTTYVANLEMRRIAPPGQVAFAPAPDFEFLNDTDRIAVSSATVPFSGNYRAIATWIRPRVRQRAPLDLWWHPRRPPTPVSASETTERPWTEADVALRVPITVYTTWFLWMAVVVVGALASGGWFFAYGAGLSDSQRAATSACIAVGSVLVSFGTATLLKMWDRWAAQD